MPGFHFRADIGSVIVCLNPRVVVAVKYMTLSGSTNAFTSGDKAMLVIGFLVMFILLLILVGVSWRIVRQSRSVDVTGSYLVGMYLSLILICAGMYLFLYLSLGAESIRLAETSNLVLSGDRLSFVGVLYQLIYFSCTVTTTTGTSACCFVLFVILQEQLSSRFSA